MAERQNDRKTEWQKDRMAERQMGDKKVNKNKRR
jgi:hypothetical protein